MVWFTDAVNTDMGVRVWEAAGRVRWGPVRPETPRKHPGRGAKEQWSVGVPNSTVR